MSGFVIIVLLLVMAALFVAPILIYFTFTHTKVFGDYGSLLSGMGSLLTAIFTFISICGMFYTLHLQRKELNQQRKQFIIERKISQLYDLQKRLSDCASKLIITRKKISHYCLIDSYEFNGISAFRQFNSDVDIIIDNLKSKVFLDFSEEELMKSHNCCEELVYSTNNPEEEDMVGVNRNSLNSIIAEQNSKFTNHFFGIDKRVYDQYIKKDDSSKKFKAIELCIKKYKAGFFTYIRTLVALSELLLSIKKECKNKDKHIYVECRKFIASNFFEEEKQFIELLASHPKFNRLNILISRKFTYSLNSCKMQKK